MTREDLVGMEQSTGRHEAERKSRFRYDAERDEPYIVLPGIPYFRLTPLRRDDEEAQVKMYSEKSVGGWALRRPFP